MPNYEKLTLDRFAENLKSGKYETLTGARRAIGKTTSWSAKEKEKAQGFALGHFGESAVKTATKVAKKVAAKAAGIGKKAGAIGRQVQKAATKAHAKSSPANKPGRKNQVARTAHQAPQERISKYQPETAGEHQMTASEALNFAHVAREELLLIKQINPSADIVKPSAQLLGIVEDAISHMGRTVSALPHPGTPVSTAVPRIAVPTNNVAAPTAAPVVEVPQQTVGQIEENNTHELTPEEQRAKELFLSSQSSQSALAGLPRPTT